MSSIESRTLTDSGRKAGWCLLVAGMIAVMLPSAVRGQLLDVPPGLSVISIPAPPAELRAADLQRLLRARFVVRSITDTARGQRFDLFMSESYSSSGPGRGFAIEVGRGYLVSLPAGLTIDLSRLNTLVGTVSVTAAGGPLSVLVFTGQDTDPSAAGIQADLQVDGLAPYTDFQLRVGGTVLTTDRSNHEGVVTYLHRRPEVDPPMPVERGSPWSVAGRS
ncbi:MAG: hypothetical protein HYY25_12555 [Candidatus Wallbacteria bacterium]|nr:hypothetical protein [Candidatus Wallbacteria bacterium]